MLFETLYKLNQLPADWKSGYITAIFKKGNKSDQSNYRPISLTSVICKIMESIIRDQIMDFFLIIFISAVADPGFLQGGCGSWCLWSAPSPFLPSLPLTLKKISWELAAR